MTITLLLLTNIIILGTLTSAFPDTYFKGGLV